MTLKQRLQSILPEAVNSRLLVVAIGVGLAVGLAVAVLDYIVIELLLDHMLELPIGLQAGAPIVGLLLTAVVLRTVGGGCSPSTSEEYITNFHSRHPDLGTRPLVARLIGGATTIGFGGALGLEGPAVYLGSTIGIRVQQRLDRYLGRGSAKLLLTAGAAAGVAALFQAPATGLIFALESPYRDDVVHRALLPSLVASASSFLAFSAVPFVKHGTVLGFTYSENLGAGHLAGAVLIGVGAGIGGRLFAWATRWAKSTAKKTSPWLRSLVGGVILCAMALVSNAIFDAPLTLGPGFAVVDWVENQPSLALLIALFFFRAAATLSTVAAGAVGGLFIPLAIQGVIFGSVVGAVLRSLDWSSEGSIWPLLGLAAFLAAGYRTPIAAVMFVAELSRGAAVVPALIAAAVSQLVAGSASVSLAQRVERMGHLEGRIALPLTSALTTDVMTVPPDATVAEFVWVHALGRRQRAMPVVDGASYLGQCSIELAVALDRDSWDAHKVTDIISEDAPVASPSWTLRDALVAMERADTDQIAVTDATGSFAGVVYEAEIVKLGEILDETQQ